MGQCSAVGYSFCSLRRTAIRGAAEETGEGIGMWRNWRRNWCTRKARQSEEERRGAMGALGDEDDYFSSHRHCVCVPGQVLWTHDSSGDSPCSVELRYLGESVSEPSKSLLVISYAHTRLVSTQEHDVGYTEEGWRRWRNLNIQIGLYVQGNI